MKRKRENPHTLMCQCLFCRKQSGYQKEGRIRKVVEYEYKIRLDKSQMDEIPKILRRKVNPAEKELRRS